MPIARTPRPLTLTLAEMLAAIDASEGVRVNRRTFASWIDVIAPSERMKRGHEGHLFSLADLARARLLLQLRRGGITMVRCRAIFAYLDAELRDVLKPHTAASLVVDHRRAFVIRPGEPDVEVPSGQLRLRLAKAWEGTERFARAAKRAA